MLDSGSSKFHKLQRKLRPQGNGSSGTPEEVRVRSRRVLALAIAAANLVALIHGAGAAVAAGGDVVLVSTNSAGERANGQADGPWLSADGTHVAFTSFATNLSPLDSDTSVDVYVKDLSTGAVSLASVTAAGTKANDQPAFGPVLSADGSRVAFSSFASNLHPADPHRDLDLYVKDLRSGALYLANTTSGGSNPFGGSPLPCAVSADGTKVAFLEVASLHPLDTDEARDVYVKDLATGALTLVSTTSAGVKANGRSGAGQTCALTPDGTRVAFASTATNLDPADTDSNVDVYVKDIVSGAVQLASADGSGVKSNAGSFSPALSADGTKIAFASTATNLVPTDTDSTEDIYLKDLETGGITLVSITGTGTKSNAQSRLPALSADGSRVAFLSGATTLVPDAADFGFDVFVKDLASGAMMLASIAREGRKREGGSDFVTISADGAKVAFHSFSPGLDPAHPDASGPYLARLPDIAVNLTAPLHDSVVDAGRQVDVTAVFAEGERGGAYTCSIDWDDGTASAGAVSATGPTRTCSGSHVFSAAGIHALNVHVSSADGRSGAASVLIVVVDGHGTVSGGGWIDSPVDAFEGSFGPRASFGLTIGHRTGTRTPSGQLQFRFARAGVTPGNFAYDFSFESDSIEWLVVTNDKAQARGTGRVESPGCDCSRPGWAFRVTVLTGAPRGEGGAEFRLKIWDPTTGGILYDNARGWSDDPDVAELQPLGGGQITVTP